MKLVKLLFYIFAIFIVLYFLPTACTNKLATYSTLEQAGYKNIQTHGYAWFACSDDDFSHTKFTAINQEGIKASGAVCCGLIFKNCTIRFD